MKDFLTLAHERYSCRKFSPRPIEQGKLDRVLEAAIAAPTGCNNQPWHAWVATDEISLKVVRASTSCHFDAPTIIILGSKADEAWTRKFDGFNVADVDAAIAGTHLMLEAADLGLATTWVAYFNPDVIQEAFTETDGYKLIGLFPIGYPADDAAPAEMHHKSKPASELTSYV